MTKQSILLFLALMSVICLPGTGAATLRQPAVAGAYYPSDSTKLHQMVAGHLDNVTNLPAIDGQIVALIVPHAGLIYSGQIAAHCYKLLEGRRIEKVILCGPSHRYGFEGLSVYGPGIEWLTPLGKVSCSDDLCGRLISFDPQIKLLAAAHQMEHCLEIQLPYLQTVLRQFEIVPVVMCYQNNATNKLLADALTSLPFDDKTVMIASTDWQHHHPASEGWKKDSLAIECIKAMDADRLEQLLATEEVGACGGGLAVAVIRAATARGANRAKVLRYGDSGDVSGDKSTVVGYIAAVLYKENVDNSIGNGNSQPDEKPKQPVEEFRLSDSDRHQLLAIARESIRSYLADGSLPEFDVEGVLTQPGAAFVTLEKHEKLRGCIGYTEAIKPLWETVSHCAISAAVNDMRFRPLKLPELDSLHIEISVLTPLVPVESITEIKVGRDGLMIVRGNQRGLLLPQVASENGWNREEFLKHTCRKAGLPTGAYLSDDAVIYKFQAIIFGE